MDLRSGHFGPTRFRLAERGATGTLISQFATVTVIPKSIIPMLPAS